MWFELHEGGFITFDGDTIWFYVKKLGFDPNETDTH